MPLCYCPLHSTVHSWSLSQVIRLELCGLQLCAKEMMFKVCHCTNFTSAAVLEFVNFDSLINVSIHHAHRIRGTFLLGIDFIPDHKE